MRVACIIYPCAAKIFDALSVLRCRSNGRVKADCGIRPLTASIKLNTCLLKSLHVEVRTSPFRVVSLSDYPHLIRYRVWVTTRIPTGGCLTTLCGIAHLYHAYLTCVLLQHRSGSRNSGLIACCFCLASACIASTAIVLYFVVALSIVVFHNQRTQTYNNNHIDNFPPYI